MITTACYDAFCEDLLRIVHPLCDVTFWLRGETLSALRATSDGWHLAAASKGPLQDLLREVDVPIREPLCEDTAPNAEIVRNCDPRRLASTNPPSLLQRLEDYFKRTYFLGESVLCGNCQAWRKADGFHQHLETCLPRPCRERCAMLSFAKAQLLHPDESFSRYEARYGRVPDYVVADAPWAMKRVLSKRYNNAPPGTP